MSANLPVECHFSSWHRRGWRKFDGIPPPLHTCTHKSIYRGKERKEGGGGEGGGGEGGREREGEEREGEEREGEGEGGRGRRTLQELERSSSTLGRSPCEDF